MILEATHTHLYPGHRGRISGLDRITEIRTGLDCLVSFSDGSAAAARISKSEDNWRLQTAPYRTAAGTDIPERAWVVCLEEDSKYVEFRILDKAQVTNS